VQGAHDVVVWKGKIR